MNFESSFAIFKIQYKGIPAAANQYCVKGIKIVLKQELLLLIEKKRAELINVVSVTGLNSQAAVHRSQELDELLNNYNKIYIKKISTK